jgi:hypothetical protein
MSDITATTVTADGVAVNHAARVKSIYYIRTSTAGSVVLKDGGASGTTLLSLTVPATEAGEDESNTLAIPSDGIRFSTNVYVDVTNVSSVTLFHA